MHPQKQQQQQLLKDLLSQEQEDPIIPHLPLTKSWRTKPQNASFCRNPCFTSSSSPDSPFLPFSVASPMIAAAVSKSPLLGGGGGPNNGLLLHVPSKTAALLLEAAMRIQKHSKPESRNHGFGFLGSVLRRLRRRNRSRKRSRMGVNGGGGGGGGDETVAVNGEIVKLEREEEDDGDLGFCRSPGSPFRFALEPNTVSAERRSPGFPSPATSPVRIMHVQEEEGTVKSQIDDEEDKEQNSPVSVLDPPFEDDEDGHRREEDDHELEERNDYDLECSYAFVQRAKKKLLHKLHRFEKLAELDPVELEKRLLEEDDEEDEDDSVEKEDEGECEEKEEEDREDSLIKDVFCQLGYQGTLQPGMKMLVTHLIDEEKDVDGLKKHSNDGLETAVKRACKRLKSWQKDEANTIDLMMKMDLAGESDDWRRPPEQITEVSMEIEVEMLVLLVNEMLEELNES